MTLEEMGELLRQERERRGLSLEKAAVEMKISKKYLIAIEQGQTGELPHPVYAKGFVKNYARLLGLDPEEMGAVLSNHYAVDDEHPREAARQDARPAARPDVRPAVLRQDVHQDLREVASTLKTRKASFASGARQTGFKPSLWLVVPLVLVFAGVAWFFFSSFGQRFSAEVVLDFFKSRMETQVPETPKPSKPSPMQQSAPSTQSQREPAQKKEERAEAKPEAGPEGNPEAVSAGSQASAPTVQRDLLAITPGAGGSGGSAGSGGDHPASVREMASEQEAITPEKLAAEVQFAASGKQVVEVDANQPASLEITTEDGKARSFTLVKGQRLSLRFNDKVAVRFIQAPSVSVKVNGKDYPLEGGKADGRTITFP